MKIEFAKDFRKKLQKLDPKIQKLFFNELEYFVTDIHHPSLRVKKMSGYKNHEIWELSLTMNFRVTFEIGKNLIFFRKIGDHKILQNP